MPSEPEPNAARTQLADLQRRMGEALCAADPVVAFAALLPDQPLDSDGVQAAAILITKLRFERLHAASREAFAWFRDDPSGFAATFRRYQLEVPAKPDPWSEAEAFARWVGAQLG